MNPYYKDKSYKIVPCFNIWNVIDNNGKVATQCSSIIEAKEELAFFQQLVAEAQLA